MSAGARWGVAACAALAVSAGALWLGAGGHLGLLGQRPEPVLGARAGPAAPVAQRPASPAGPMLPAAAQPRARLEMPADVRAWLEHLERIERQRVAISQRQLGAMMVELATAQGAGAAEALRALANPDPDAPESAPPAERFGGRIETLKAEWRLLVEEFNSLPPPRECAPVRNDYDQALRETGAMMLDVLDAIEMASTDPAGAVQKLTAMKGTSARRIDAAAESADRGVSEICERYGVRKWFTITGDVGGGLLGRLGGL
jgi:hypothetical protein